MNRQQKYKNTQQQITLALCIALSILIAPLAPTAGNLSSSGGGGGADLVKAFYNNLFAAQPAAAQAGVVYGVRNQTDFGYLDSGWNWVSVGTLSPQTDGFGMVDEKTGIAVNDNFFGSTPRDRFVLIDLQTGAETPLTPTNGASFVNTDYETASYDGATDTFYAKEESDSNIYTFSVDVTNQTITYVGATPISGNNDTDDWVFHEGTLYGVDGGLLSISVATGISTKVNIADLTNGGNFSGEISGIWKTPQGEFQYMKGNSEIYQLDLTNPAAPTAIQLGNANPNNIWSNNSDDLASFGNVVSGSGLRGIVFQDDNTDGRRNSTEPGIEGATVTAVDASGIITSTLTDANGGYAFTDTALSGSTRVTFTLPSSLQASMQPTVLGSHHRTTVQFVHMGDRWAVASAGFAFRSRTATCDNPTIASACYTAGTASTEAALLSFNWQDGVTAPNSDATGANIGAIWGNAHNANTGRLYSAAVLKRHVGLGPLAARSGNDVTIDGVYFTDYAPTGGGTFNPAAPGFTLQGVSGIDLGTVQRILDTNGTLDNDYELLPGNSVDLDAFAKVGTVGFGDADIGPLGDLWLVNLNQRTLIRVNTTGLPSDGSAAPGGNVTTTPIANPGCSNGDFRPWALTFHNGLGYLGIVCSAETSQSRADLHAYVRSFDPTNMGAGFTPIVDVSLDFARENLYIRLGKDDTALASDWRPWASTYSAFAGTVGGYGNPQPILSDIEFNIDGDMILGFMDRFGHQTHQTNLEAKPLAQSPQVRSFVTAGDMVNFCATSTGWVIEGDANCPTFDSGGVKKKPGGGVAGPFEFYSFEEAGICADHVFYFEIYGGGACIGPDGRSVLSTVYFPGGENSGVRSNDPQAYGFRTFSTDDGSMPKDSLAAALPDTLMCANGQTHNMGELACFCPPPPVEIGSRVWQDSNLNGIQDAGEPGIEGVTVQLVDSSDTPIIGATATTDARGEYFFSSGSGTSTSNVIYNLGIPGAGVSVRILNAIGGSQQAPLAGHAVTIANQGSDDTLDSDTTLSGNDALVAVDTAGGRIDHSYDFGFAPNVWDLALRKSAPVQYAASNDTVVFTIEVYNQSIGPVDNINIIDYVPANLTANNTNWAPATQAGPGTVTRLLNAGDELSPAGLLPGTSVAVQITMTVAGSLPDNTVIVNTAEIAAFTTFGGTAVTDIDSTPDSTDNETNIKDGVISEDGLNNAGEDEDDHDIEQITITSQTNIYDLALRKRLAADQPSVVSIGDDVHFTIEVFNQGTNGASSITLVDRYPAGFSLSPNDGNWTDVGGTSATYALPNSLNAGTSTSVDIILRAGTTTGVAQNFAEIQDDNGNDVDSQPENDENDNNGDALIDDVTSDNGTLDEDDHDVAEVTVQSFDLALRKTLAAGQPTATVRGADITYVIEVFNQGTVPAFDITVIDYISSTLSLSENDGNGWVLADIDELVNTIPGPIAPTRSERLTVTLRVSDTASLGALDNFAEIASASDAPGGAPVTDVDSTPDDNKGNDLLVDDEIDNDGTTDEDDHDIASVTVERFDLALIKEFVSDTQGDPNDGIIGIGDQVVFRITVTNQGDVPAYDIRVSDHNPEGIVADDSDPAFNIDNGWLTENMVLNHNVLPGPLNPGASTTVDIVLRSVPPTSILYPDAGLIGTHTNWAEISSASNMPGGPSVIDDDSTPDEDATNDAGGTPGSAADNATSGDGTGAAPDANAATDEDDHDPAQVTVQNTFDLALFKYVVGADGNPITSIPEVQAGDTITYGYFVENQGTEEATSITLIEHVPDGLILADVNWTPSNVVGPGTATRTYSSALAPGDYFTDTVIFQAAPSIQSGQVYTTFMEIQSATNGAGLTDADSDPDSDATNEIFVEDNQVFANFRLNPAIFDEDDHDPAAVQAIAFEQVAITKTLRSVGPFIVGSPLVYDIRIENVGSLPVATVPLTDTYDIAYLGYNSAQGANPEPDDNINDGQLTWADVTGSGTLGSGEVMTVTVNFIAAGDTSALADDPSCANSGAGEAINTATVDLSTAISQTSCVGIAIAPSPGKSTLGDFVWYDKDGDGIKDAGEEGIDGVRVELYEVIDAGSGLTTTQFITFQVTGPDRTGIDGAIDSDDTPTYGDAGAYDFLVPDSKVYQVVITDTNFLPGGALENYVYTGEVPDPDEAYSGPNPRTVPIGNQVDYNDADFPFTLLPQLAVSKVLNGDNPFGTGTDIDFTIVVTNTGPVTLTVVPLEDRYSNIFLRYISASVPPSTTNAGVITWGDLTTTLGDIAPGATISLTVTFETLSDTTLLQPVAPCTSSGHTPNIVEIDGAMADPDGDDGAGDDVTVVQDTDDHDCAEVQILNPTAVQLAERGMGQTPDGVLVRWSTTNESSIVGFHIWMSNGTDAQRRSSEMIAATNAGQSSGASYQWLDAGAALSRGDTYILELVNVDGSTEHTVIGIMSGGPIFLPLVAK